MTEEIELPNQEKIRTLRSGHYQTRGDEGKKKKLILKESEKTT